MKHVLASLAGALGVLAGSGAIADNPKVSLCNPLPPEGSFCACPDPEPTCVAASSEGPSTSFSLYMSTDLAPPLLGWQIDIVSDGNLQILEFVELPVDTGSMLHHLQTNPEGSPEDLQINWVYDGSNPWPSGSQWIGTVKLHVGTELSTLSVKATSAAVKSVTEADPALVSIDADDILLPEPSHGGLLIAGIGLLFLLSGPGRRRRASALSLLLAVTVGSAARAEIVAASRTLVDADLELASTPELGAAMAAAGDLDGDGVDDLILGLPDADSGRGQVLLAALRRDGSVDRVWTIGEGEGGFTDLLDPGDAFGTAVTSLGDVNGDGVPDLAVAAPGANRVWLLLLRRGGVTGTDLFVNHSHKVGLSGPVYALAGLGDVDFDGVPDLALGHPGYGGVSCGAGGSCGLVTILRLNSDASPKVRSVFGAGAGDVPTPVSGDRFGASLAPLGDLDGNGWADLAVGMPGYDSDRGSVALLLLGIPSSSSGGGGGPAIIVISPSSFPAPVGGMRLDDSVAGFPTSLQPGDRFGSALASVGDWEGNGTLDLVVGAPGRGPGGAGAAFLLPLEAPASGGGVHGTGAVFDASAGELLDAFGPGTAFGRSLTALNIDGDVDMDILVGAAADAPGLHPGLAWQLHLSDADGDGGPDAFADNCPGVINPGQLDADGDGRGDICDNCANTENGPSAGRCTAGDTVLLMAACSADADCNGSVGGGFCSTDQEDADLDGVGDVCEGPEVRLTGPYDPDASIPERHWKLELDCGAHNVTELALALFQPDLSLPLNLHFSDCELPPVFAGLGCGAVGATPGARVGSDSGAFMSDASGAFVAGGLAGLRPNTLYAFLEGDSAASDRLCDAFDVDVPLGWFGNPPADIANLSVAASQLELVGSGPGAMLVGTDPLDRFCLRDWPALTTGHAPSFAKKFAKAAVFDPEIHVSLNPALPPAITAVGEGNPATYQAWEVCFQSDEPLKRIKLSIEPPLLTAAGISLYDRDDMTWVGCDDVSTENTCTKTYEEDGFLYPVLGAESELHRPDPLTPIDDGRGNRIYPVLSGAKLGFNSEYARLNTLPDGPPYEEFWHCIGQVRVAGGADASNQMPIIFMKGETYLRWVITEKFCFDDDNLLGCGGNSFESPSNDPKSEYCENLEDDDEDGVRIEADNCPYFYNPMQRDNGSLKAAAPYGRDNLGDACQCGEGDGDGIISQPGDGPGSWIGEDLQNLLHHLVGNPPADFDEERCNLIDSPGASKVCNILDAVKLKQGLVASPESMPNGLPKLCTAVDPPSSDL